MLQLLGQAVFLGLVAALTPTLLALQVLVVAGPDWGRRAIAVIVGSTSAFVLFFLLGMTVLQQLPDANTGSSSDVVRIGEGIAAAVLAVAGIVLLRPRPRAASSMEGKLQKYADDARPRTFLMIAFYFSITDFSSFVVLLPGLHAVSRSDADLIVRALALVVLLVLTLLPVWGPPLAVVVTHGAARAPLQRLYRFVMAHDLQIMGVMALLVAAYLAWDAL